MTLTKLAHRLFGRLQIVHPADLARAMPDNHHLAVYIFPLQGKIALTIWVVPNSRGGWKIAPKGRP